ncbi:MAG: DUF87 domain-containing protein [Candidatus Paceibacterota bacterium]|nr:MAG: DUF87 domain-containing protein [Candidatus Paceibacterota bacterium]
MSGIFLIAYGAVFILTAAAALVFFGSLRARGRIMRGMDMSLYRVTLPREAQSSQKSDRELIAVMEQLFTSITSIHARGWNKFVYGEPYIALEMAVHHKGEDIFFYCAVPKNYEAVFVKQVHGLYPSAEVVQSPEYTIFHPSGVFAGSYLSQKKEAILPFRTYARLESDPLGGIISALSKLEKEGEGAAIQILIRPSHKESVRSLAQRVAQEMQKGSPFKEAFARVRSSKKQEQDESAKPATAFEDDVIKALQSKASRPLFDTNVRILVSAETQDRADAMLKDIESSFVQLGSPDLNELAPLGLRARGKDKLAYEYAFRMFNDAYAMQLSSEELASIYHFPLQHSQAARVAFSHVKAAEPPTNLPEQGIVLGANVFRGQERPVRMTDSDRRRHLYVVGQTGTGKTTFMKHMIAQDIRAGKGVCVIDPHGDFAEYALSVVPKERVDDVIYFNPGDTDRPLGLNILEFDPTKPEQKTFLSNELLAIIKSLYKSLPEAFGPMFEQYFKNAILLVMDVYERAVREKGSKEGLGHLIPTMADIPRILVDEDYRREKLALEDNPLVKSFWELEAEKAGGEAALANMAPYINSKLNPFLANDYLRPIVGQKVSALDFRAIMDGQKILIVNLSKGRIGEMNANLLGMMIVSRLLLAALGRVDLPEDQRKDFYLYIDEFQNVTTDSIATILSEARKYRLDLIIAHQYIKQIPESIRDAVFGNVGSQVAFRIGADDAEALKNKFEPVFTPADLSSIDNFNAHVRMLIEGQSARPFSIQTIREPAGDQRLVSALAELSRLTHGRPRALIEEELKSGYRTNA